MGNFAALGIAAPPLRITIGLAVQTKIATIADVPRRKRKAMFDFIVRREVLTVGGILAISAAAWTTWFLIPGI